MTKVSLKNNKLSFSVYWYENLPDDVISYDYHARVAEPANNRPGFKLMVKDKMEKIKTDAEKEEIIPKEKNKDENIVKSIFTSAHEIRSKKD